MKTYKEHDYIEDATNVDIRQFPLQQYAEGRKRLGINVDGNPIRLKANYFIGCTWLDEKTPIQIKPKIDNLDWLAMFKLCLESTDKEVHSKLSDLFGLENELPPISGAADNRVNIFLILYFANLLKPILAKGFKSNFVLRQENLNSKVKGAIDFNQHLRKNVFTKHEERVYCRFQEYDIDCLENQVLKRAVKIALKQMDSYQGEFESSIKEMRGILMQCKRKLGNVGELKSVSQIRSLNVNRIYLDYKLALQAAKHIILWTNVNPGQLQKEGEGNIVPYWINMPLLFELYVLIKLREAFPDQIDYHKRTYGNELDFCKKDEKLIIDAKYILDWTDSVKHENIRQLSGYARNVSIREKVMMSDCNDTEILPILIVYPDKKGVEKFSKDEGLIKQAKPIRNSNDKELYIKTYKIGVKLPIIKLKKNERKN